MYLFYFLLFWEEINGCERKLGHLCGVCVCKRLLLVDMHIKAAALTTCNLARCFRQLSFLILSSRVYCDDLA